MPNFDGTGPEGKGPRTGRMQGNCKPNKNEEAPTYPRLGRKLGRRMGLGRGLRQRQNASS